MDYLTIGMLLLIITVIHQVKAASSICGTEPRGHRLPMTSAPADAVVPYVPSTSGNTY